jgi:hypothetical protein
MEWLEANFRMVISDYHRAFVTKFSRPDVELIHLNQLRKRKGWRVGRDGSRYKGRLRTYTPAEMEWLAANQTLPISEYHSQFVERFGREVTPGALHGLRKRYGWKTGRTGHFEKGHESHNKGKTCAPGTGGRHPNAQRTQFKSGQLPHNTKFLGHERVSKDGYVEISIDEENPHTGYERRYVLKHLHLWEKLNGPVPEGQCLKCLDGDRLNTDPSNWLLIPRGVLPRLNGGRATRVMAYDTAPAELKPVLMTMARVDHKASELRRDRTTPKSSGCTDGE